MERFRQLLIAARDGIPFTCPNPAAIRRAGAELTEQDVRNILDELDAMSRERNALPDWDGDSTDTIALYQEDLPRLLGEATGAARQALEQDNAEREPITRSYIAIAMEKSKSR